MRISDWSSDVCSSDLRLALVVLDAVDIDLDLVADGELGLLARRGEFAQRDAAFGFQADVDDGHVVLDRGDGALDDAAFTAFVLAAEGLIEPGRGIVAGGGCSSGPRALVQVGRASWRGRGWQSVESSWGAGSLKK